MEKLDSTGERALSEVWWELCGQSKDVQSIVGETIEAGAWQTIAEDRTGIMNAFLSIHHAARILAGNAQQRREVAVAPKEAKKVLSGGGSIMSLFGDESKHILAEVVKTQRLIDSQRSVESKAEPGQNVSVKKELGTVEDLLESYGELKWISWIWLAELKYAWPSQEQFSFGTKRPYQIRNDYYGGPKLKYGNQNAGAQDVGAPAPKST
ncbi:MAG: hypothetical protein EZS28_048163 [Streblomastix strix]|uniref:Uncharacterized protein n=1 Tax=Streblomastix strix TaxID=222440 RepID=A0A5J4TF85_9EUKA|nr:MAG: hypothetical protein EZS28_048163 [Streblomastix strix]